MIAGLSDGGGVMSQVMLLPVAPLAQVAGAVSVMSAAGAVSVPVPSKVSVPVASWNTPVPPLTSACGTVAV